MARYENALRKTTLLFLIMNLLMPLGTASAYAEDTNPTDPPAIQETSGEDGTQDPPPVIDTDNGGFPDTEDSCPSVANTGIDTDGDGIDDACDPVLPADSDGDGISDNADICANGNDTIDSDNDGTPDACDSTPNGDQPELIAVAPVNPIETIAACNPDGTLTAPSLTMETPGIIYAVDPATAYTAGGTVIITASLADNDHIWDTTFASAVWTLNTETNTYSRSFTFTDVPCEDTTAGPKLDNNLDAEPSFDIGLTSVVDDPIIIGSDDKIPVCHLLGNGEYNRPNPNVGQFIEGNGHASHPGDIWPTFIYDGTLYIGRGTVPEDPDDPNCAPYTNAIPGTPSLGTLTCGEDPEVILPTTDGITYSVSGPVNHTYTITATAIANAYMLASNLPTVTSLMGGPQHIPIHSAQ